MGLRVVGPQRARPPGPVRSFLRAVACVAFPLGLFWSAFSKRNASVHDLVFRTTVIYYWRMHVPASRSANCCRADGSRSTTRWARLYTLQRSSRTNPTIVIPNRSPASTASDDGALTALTIGMPATAAFCTISKLARPLTCRMWPASGTRPRAPARRSPCRPRCGGRRPRAGSRARPRHEQTRGVQPTVRSKTRWPARSAPAAPARRHRHVRSGRDRRTSHLDVVQRCLAADPARGRREEVAVQAGGVEGPRERDRHHVEPLLVIVQVVAVGDARPSSGAMRPSVNKNPAASSKSPPGVRIVTATGVASCPGPETRISNGSSLASVSGRSERTPSLTATTRTGSRYGAGAEVGHGLQYPAERRARRNVRLAAGVPWVRSYSSDRLNARSNDPPRPSTEEPSATHEVRTRDRPGRHPRTHRRDRCRRRDPGRRARAVRAAPSQDRSVDPGSPRRTDPMASS